MKRVVVVVVVETYITHLLILSKVYEHRDQVRLEIFHLYCLKHRVICVASSRSDLIRQSNLKIF